MVDEAKELPVAESEVKKVELPALKGPPPD